MVSAGLPLACCAVAPIGKSTRDNMMGSIRINLFISSLLALIVSGSKAVSPDFDTAHLSTPITGEEVEAAICQFPNILFKKISKRGKQAICQGRILTGAVEA
ncbi:hypothetical protein Sfum_0913 [Syntrophobacter fumaroxidans MPOB]|uniref:Uncharacterized protein n=1 Tax=Syntrophobacter fumaroxidans (strain DSM 10017 / MPOB) TaxID=335543 RepID=A0LGQ7_SYNFM|nr:hypothetical protein Sfum_0913 [Syntrophobacter fumaroxidans MPOB]